MDATTFDALARATGRAVTRRVVAVPLVVLALAAGRPATGAVACRNGHQTCGDGRGRCCNGLACCNGRCRNLRNDERLRQLRHVVRR